MQFLLTYQDVCWLTRITSMKQETFLPKWGKLQLIFVMSGWILLTSMLNRNSMSLPFRWWVFLLFFFWFVNISSWILQVHERMVFSYSMRTVWRSSSSITTWKSCNIWLELFSGWENTRKPRWHSSEQDMLHHKILLSCSTLLWFSNVLPCKFSRMRSLIWRQYFRLFMNSKFLTGQCLSVYTFFDSFSCGKVFHDLTAISTRRTRVVKLDTALKVI